ncbi:hypothetical protein C7212DRAFT_347623 [Tuber magnatum]|uniref:Ubiquitin 3 binding protein But2 C-terminal domain-containing protein n=1 Tax=Tuber magnatum TaxID=42249 RepID=A0A317SES8_9PEZI|nr:hypothetical protein C7212DRAFT_347623 [Tuber magnatum]
METQTAASAPHSSRMATLVVMGLNLIPTDSEPHQAPSQPSNIFRAGFNALPTISEEVTLTVFDFPSRFENKNCTFHIITSGGVNVPSSVIFSVWNLKDKGKDVSPKTTWNTKTPRDAFMGIPVSKLQPVSFGKNTFQVPARQWVWERKTRTRTPAYIREYKLLQVPSWGKDRVRDCTDSEDPFNNEYLERGW